MMTFGKMVRISFVLIISLLAIVGLLYTINNFFDNHTSSKKYTYNYDILDNTLDYINTNCGGTYITKKPLDESWYIFTEVENNEGYSKYIYVSLYDCLNK